MGISSLNSTICDQLVRYRLMMIDDIQRIRHRTMILQSGIHDISMLPNQSTYSVQALYFGQFQMTLDINDLVTLTLVNALTPDDLQQKHDI